MPERKVEKICVLERERGSQMAEAGKETICVVSPKSFTAVNPTRNLLHVDGSFPGCRKVVAFHKWVFKLVNETK